jgi:hypothetical protein
VIVVSHKMINVSVNSDENKLHQTYDDDVRLVVDQQA